MDYETFEKAHVLYEELKQTELEISRLEYFAESGFDVSVFTSNTKHINYLEETLMNTNDYKYFFEKYRAALLFRQMELKRRIEEL